jgi:polysaccharide biosynthesis protein VpsM
MSVTRAKAGLVAVLATALLMAGGPTTPAAAIDMNAVFPDLDLPGFRVIPYVTERVEYESNLFGTPSHAQDDFVSKTIPGILVSLPLGRHRLDLGARAEILRYFDLTNQDTEHYFFLGDLKLDFPGGLRAGLNDDFARTSDPPGTELTGRIKSTTNSLHPSVGYAFADRYEVGFDYVWTHVSFDSLVQVLDRDEHTFGVTGFYKVAPNTRLLASYSYGIKQFDNDSERDVTRHIAVIGVQGNLTSRLSSTFRIGVEKRDPSSSNVRGYMGMIAGGDWVFTPTDRTRFTLITERFLAESVFQTNPYYVANMVTFGVEQQLLPKLRLTGRLFGGTNEYPDKAQRVNGNFAWRSDEVFGASIGAEYDIQRWLLVGADYTETRRYSNFENFQYKDNIVGAKVTLKF